MSSRTRILTLTALAVAVLAAGAGAAIVIINNNAPTTAHAPTPLATRSQAAPTPSATPVPLTRYDPTASVKDNFVLFNSTAATTIAATPNPGGRSFIAALSAVGFDTAKMQLTADRTSVNLDAPSILFSVNVAGSCFIGQFTPSTREYNNQMVAPISTGSCLIGGTVAVK
ncbi:MAG: hypothetical protein JWP70_2263 [Leifsonia sp.]|jgi:hypothetical protein|nr:hypothetical protein [Leifsonia sp.]